MTTNDNNLTPKQEAFALKYVELGNASEAYRQAYNTDEMKSETVHRKANELMSNGKITARIDELKAEHQARHKLTVDDLLIDLDEARNIAKENGNANAMISATMAKAKLLGLDKPTLEVAVNGTLDNIPTVIELVAPSFDNSNSWSP
ncbi:terminase small subunit [Actinobacillus equuli subsp. haemolyticus]|nr:terminase small subunit [Actinobacillus equuli subsp. haemolyticus]